MGIAKEVCRFRHIPGEKEQVRQTAVYNPKSWLRLRYKGFKSRTKIEIPFREGVSLVERYITSEDVFLIPAIKWMKREKIVVLVEHSHLRDKLSVGYFKYTSTRKEFEVIEEINPSVDHAVNFISMIAKYRILKKKLKENNFYTCNPSENLFSVIPLGVVIWNVELEDGIPYIVYGQGNKEEAHVDNLLRIDKFEWTSLSPLLREEVLTLSNERLRFLATDDAKNFLVKIGHKTYRSLGKKWTRRECRLRNFLIKFFNLRQEIRKDIDEVFRTAQEGTLGAEKAKLLSGINGFLDWGTLNNLILELNNQKKKVEEFIRSLEWMKDNS